MNASLFARLATASLMVAAMAVGGAETPEWLWFQKTSGTDVRFFRKTFTVDGKISQAEVIATADDSLEVFVNGQSVLKNSHWPTPLKADVTAKINSGQNVLALRALNKGSSAAGVLARLHIKTDKGTTIIVTDASWKA